MDVVTAVAVAVISAVVGGVVTLVLEHKTPLFSPWLHRGEEVDNATIRSTVEQIHELKIAAKQAIEAVTMLGAWEAQDRAFEAARLTLARLKDSDLLSAELRDATYGLMMAAGGALMDIKNRYEITREERLRSIAAAQARLDELLALTDKELAALRRKG